MVSATLGWRLAQGAKHCRIDGKAHPVEMFDSAPGLADPTRDSPHPYEAPLDLGLFSWACSFLSKGGGNAAAD
jgi:hypothetical protein